MMEGHAAGKDAEVEQGLDIVSWPQVALLPEASSDWALSCIHKALPLLKQLDAAQDRLKAVERHWQQVSGFPVEESSFTLLLPIHDEEKSLGSVLHALLGADLPPSVSATVVLVTNACKDRSAVIVGEFLESLGRVHACRDLDDLDGADLSMPAREVRIGSVRFLHLDTPVPGKANALNLGNRIAQLQGDRIVMSLDTNNWIEPDSLAVLFGDAYRRIVATPDGTAMLYAHPVLLIRSHRGSLYNIMQRKHSGIPVPVDEENLNIPGWMMAWDSSWLASVGEVPNTATEDYAMGVVARGSGRKVGFSRARVWGFGIATVRDLLAGGRRFVRGELQLAENFRQDPVMARQVRSECLHSGPFSARFANAWKRIRERPLRFPVHIAHFLIWELAYHQGKSDYRKAPMDSSWTSIESTK